jgi:tetratricopeptide (TPR) repeat protein
MYKSKSYSGKKGFKNNPEDKYQGSWRSKAEIENKETTACSKEAAENKEATAYYNKGMAAFNLKRYEKAVGYYDQALSIDPEYFDAHYRKGTALYKSGNLREAISCYDKALRNSRGVIIIEEYETVMRSDCAEVYYNKGIVLEDMGKNFEATECYENAVTIQPDHIEANFRMGLALFKLEESEEALKYYNNILSVNPKHVEVLYNKGNALFSLQKMGLALRCYEDASLIESKSDLSMQGSAIEMQTMMMSYSKARSLFRSGDLNKAIAWYERALRQCDANIKNPYNEGLKEGFEAFYATVYCDIGNIFFDFGDIEKAFKYYDDAIVFKADYADAYYYKGVALYRTRKWKKAIENYDKAIFLKANHAYAYYHKGLVLYDMERLEEAIACLYAGFC